MLRSNLNHSDTSVSSLSLLLISIGSLAFYVLISFVVIRFFHGLPFLSPFSHGWSLSAQLAIGIAAGLAGALIIGIIMFYTPMREILRDYTVVKILAEMRFSEFDRGQISFFAGIGEELLFRGSIQPLLGVWLTSLLFVAIHGYFKFHSGQHLIFGFMMFALSAGLGFLFEWAGLIAAITAHTVYDFIMLQMGQSHDFGKSKAAIEQ